MAASAKRQLHNWLSLDAALIAVAWQLGLAAIWQQDLSTAAPYVLALSVWLGYVADRLYDVRSRGPQHLLSDRHRFAARYAGKLWLCWFAALGLNLVLAFSLLPLSELIRGFYLLGFCLVYTGVHQLTAKRFFPKELCVAVLYVAGIFLFLEPPYATPVVCLLVGICLFNCLSIGQKEVCIDQALQVRTLTRYLSPHIMHGLAASIFIAAICLKETVYTAIAATIFAQWLLYSLRHTCSLERFRLLADALLLIGPAILFLV